MKLFPSSSFLCFPPLDQIMLRAVVLRVGWTQRAVLGARALSRVPQRKEGSGKDEPQYIEEEDDESEFDQDTLRQLEQQQEGAPDQPLDPNSERIFKEISSNMEKILDERLNPETNPNAHEEVDSILEALYTDITLQAPDVRIDKNSSHSRGLKATKSLKAHQGIYSEVPLVSIGVTKLSAFPSDTVIPLTPSHLCRQCHTPLLHQVDRSILKSMLHPEGDGWMAPERSKELEETKQRHRSHGIYCGDECSTLFDQHYSAQSHFVRAIVEKELSEKTFSKMQDLFPLLSLKVACRIMTGFSNLNDNLEAADIFPILSRAPERVSSVSDADYQHFMTLFYPILQSLQKDSQSFNIVSCLFSS